MKSHHHTDPGPCLLLPATRTIRKFNRTWIATIVGTGQFHVMRKQWRWRRLWWARTYHWLDVEGYCNEHGTALGIGFFLDRKPVDVNFQIGGWIMIDGNLYHGVTKEQAVHSSGLLTSQDVFLAIMRELATFDP